MNLSIATNGLTKKYGKATVVKHLNLSVPQNSVYGFLGPNGAGKTTTLKMLLGLIHPNEGSMQLMGERFSSKNRLHTLKKMGSLIESPSYYGHLTAYENLEIICSLKTLPKTEIERVLQIVRLEHAADKKAAAFSLGMKQRLGIAAALLGMPSLLLLDEPTNGLDPSGIQEMRELIKSLPASYGITVLISSHLLSEIEHTADHVGIIHKGHLLFQDSMQALHETSQKSLFLSTSDNPKARSILTMGDIKDETLILPFLSKEERIRMTLTLADHGIGITRMEENIESLEDIFLEMTKEGAPL